MKELKEVIRDIGEILDSAEMYAKEAVKHKMELFGSVNKY